MAMLLPQKQDDYPENHEINVTPFIDVMLVLLIIFMVVAPLSTVSVSVDLPSSTAEPQAPEEMPVILTLDTDSSLRLGESRQIGRSELADALTQATRGNLQQVIFVQADKRVDYGALMQLLDQLREAVISKLHCWDWKNPLPRNDGFIPHFPSADSELPSLPVAGGFPVDSAVSRLYCPALAPAARQPAISRSPDRRSGGHRRRGKFTIAGVEQCPARTTRAGSGRGKGGEP